MKLKFWGNQKPGADHDSAKLQKPPSREELRLPEEGLKGQQQQPFYGIRNYLHQFYQSPTAEDLEGAAGWYLLPPGGHRRRGLYICRGFTIIGLILLLIGAAAIVIGYTWPKPDWERTLPRLSVQRDDEGDYINVNSVIKLLEDPMRPWKFAGLGIFTLGGVILAISLLVPTCANFLGGGIAAGFASQFETPNEPPIRIFPSDENEETNPKQPLSPIEKKVPVMEAIAKVQPEAEPGEGRITGESLQSAESEAEFKSEKKEEKDLME